MEMLRDEDLALLAKGKEKAYLRDSRLMAQELIARRAGQNPEPEQAVRPVPYDYKGIIVAVPQEQLDKGLYLDSLAYVKTGQTVLFESSRGYHYIVHRVD